MTDRRLRSARRYILFARTASLAVTVIACLVLVGWILGVEWLKSVLPGHVSMKPNTAMALLSWGNPFATFFFAILWTAWFGGVYPFTFFERSVSSGRGPLPE